MGYLIAAYAVVIGSLAAYGLWVRSQRRALDRGPENCPGRAPTSSKTDSERS